MGSLFAGIDIGSTTSKAVLIDEDGKIVNFSIIDTRFDRNQSGEDVLATALKAIGKSHEDLICVASTGYGRRSFNRSQKVLPEIVCHARGTDYLMPHTKTIIDIGGQDSKVIEIGAHGTVEKFEMNDKCAAGTGRFFEVLTGRLLNISLDELGPLALKSRNPSVISSMCTIFAESEIISFLSLGVPTEDIAMGMLISVAKRILAMGRQARIAFAEPIVFSGGTATNVAAKKAFEDLLEKPIIAIENPQITAALGVALFAMDERKAALCRGSGTEPAAE
jgi:predicted CoA-substrate-specific enzyme activase